MEQIREISLDGLSQKEMSPESRIALKAMQRGVREARKEYKRFGLKMVTADRNGKIIYKEP